jgi:hypothetical protein
MLNTNVLILVHCTALMQDINNIGNCGQEVWTLHLLLSFSKNVKLISQIKHINVKKLYIINSK